MAEAYGGLALVAQEAGITREALYRALSPTGNPTLKTLLAVLHALGMRLSVAPAGRTVIFCNNAQGFGATRNHS
ncbi:hypothetical protein D3C87_1972950 [compost metagenome]